MKIEIDTKSRPLCVYAVSTAGWGRGDTVSDALREMYKASRGCYNSGSIVEDLENQRIALYLSDETDGIEFRFYTPCPSVGHFCLHLGDVYNKIKVYGHRD